ncbi:hypothetical protein B0H13DRAFT_1925614 [Mycena leptocephala]|nr:hypothetical protein B0H13DRAFT_1925614 [Mycena leptocephala]
MNSQAEIHRLKSEILEGTTIQDPYSYGLALVNIAEIDGLIGSPKDDVQRNCDRARKMLDTLGNAEGVTISPPEGGKSIDSTNYFKKLLGLFAWDAELGNCFLVHSFKRKEKVGIYKALRSLGDIFRAQHDEHTATSLFTVALEGFTKMDVHHSRAECMLRLGDISMGHSEPLKAVEFWERARPLFERSSQAKQVQRIDERIANISEDVLEQHRNNLAHLAELNALTGTIKELEEDLSDIKGLDKADIDDEKELDLFTA